MLNTIRLRILREVAARGTITAAADALYLTPPAVSHQLATLEREVGVPLLERTARSIRLTDAGKRLVSHAETILAECEAALADVAAFSEEVSGTVRISVFQTAAQSIALPAMVRLTAEHPGLDLQASELEPVNSLPALRAGQLDIALSHEWDFVPMADEPSIDRYELLEEPVMVLLPLGHPLAGTPVRLRDLAHERWCVAKESATSRQAVERVAQAAGFEPHIILESNYFRALGAAVEAGLGVGIAPLMTDLRGLNIAIQPLVEPKMSRRIFAAVRAGSGDSPAMRAVLGALQDAANAFSALPAPA
ncbi:MAG TPA: LysR family transcriptional regulator [Coriobacteriia bacterium]